MPTANDAESYNTGTDQIESGRPDIGAPTHDQTTSGRGCDVIVVGAGPAGIAAAIHLHWLGLDVEVFDKAQFPRDKCCGDGLTALALRELERIQFHPRSIASWRPLDGATLVSPSGRSVRVPLPDPANGLFAAVAPRRELDDGLVTHARSIGITVHEGHSITALEQERTLLTARFAVQPTEDADPRPHHPSIVARYLIAADGAWSPVRKLVGAATDGYRGDWQGMRQYADGVSGPAASEMMIWFERDLLPGYLWSFPLPDSRANVGFGVLRKQGRKGGGVAALWPELIERPHIAEAFGATAELDGRHTAWPIPTRIDELPLVDHRVLFVGDAAAASDVLTGEGIGQALLTGRLAAEAVRRGGSDTASTVTADYRRSVRRELFADHRMSRRLGSMMSTPAGAERALGIIARSGDWGKKNFARWLFEDEPRGILMTPSRWHRGFLDRAGAYRS